MSRSSDSLISHQEEGNKPRRRNSLSDILVVLVALGAVFVIVLVPSINAPLRELFSGTVHGPVHPALYPSMTVWADKDAGVYYCPGSALYGSGGGVYMKQGDALTRGYQPVLGSYCNEPAKKATKKSIVTRPDAYRGR